MIRPLRRTHRGVVTLLAATVPAALVVILLQRPPAAALAQPPEASPFSISAPADIDGHRQVVITAAADRPEVLVYWATSESSAIDAQAMLIGRLDSATTRLSIPDDLRGGQVLLFSPPLNRIVATLTLPSGTVP